MFALAAVPDRSIGLFDALIAWQGDAIGLDTGACDRFEERVARFGILLAAAKLRAIGNPDPKPIRCLSARNERDGSRFTAGHIPDGFDATFVLEADGEACAHDWLG